MNEKKRHSLVQSGHSLLVDLDYIEIDKFFFLLTATANVEQKSI